MLRRTNSKPWKCAWAIAGLFYSGCWDHPPHVRGRICSPTPVVKGGTSFSKFAGSFSMKGVANFLKNYFINYVYMCVYVHTCGLKRRHWITWSWNYKANVSCTAWVQGTKLMPSARVFLTAKRSLQPLYWFLIKLSRHINKAQLFK